MSREERRRVATLLVEALTAVNTPERKTVLAPRTLANLLRFLRKKPLNLQPR
jgi:hypothetical protein